MTDREFLEIDVDISPLEAAERKIKEIKGLIEDVNKGGVKTPGLAELNKQLVEARDNLVKLKQELSKGVDLDVSRVAPPRKSTGPKRVVPRDEPAARLEHDVPLKMKNIPVEGQLSAAEKAKRSRAAALARVTELAKQNASAVTTLSVEEKKALAKQKQYEDTVDNANEALKIEEEQLTIQEKREKHVDVLRARMAALPRKVLKPVGFFVKGKRVDADPGYMSSGIPALDKRTAQLDAKKKQGYGPGFYTTIDKGTPRPYTNAGGGQYPNEPITVHTRTGPRPMYPVGMPESEREPPKWKFYKPPAEGEKFVPELEKKKKAQAEQLYFAALRKSRTFDFLQDMKSIFNNKELNEKIQRLFDDNDREHGYARKVNEALAEYKKHKRQGMTMIKELLIKKEADLPGALTKRTTETPRAYINELWKWQKQEDYFDKLKGKLIIQKRKKFTDRNVPDLGPNVDLTKAPREARATEMGGEPGTTTPELKAFPEDKMVKKNITTRVTPLSDAEKAANKKNFLKELEAVGATEDHITLAKQAEDSINKQQKVVQDTYAHVGKLYESGLRVMTIAEEKAAKAKKPRKRKKKELVPDSPELEKKLEDVLIEPGVVETNIPTGPGLTPDQLKKLQESKGLGKEIGGSEGDPFGLENARAAMDKMIKEATSPAEKLQAEREDISYDAELKKYQETGKLAADKAKARSHQVTGTIDLDTGKETPEFPLREVKDARAELIDVVKKAGVKTGLDIDETLQSMNSFSILFGENSKGFLDPDYMNAFYGQFEKLNQLSPIYDKIRTYLGKKSVLITARPDLVGLHEKAGEIGKKFGAVATFIVKDTKEKAALIKELGLETYYDEDAVQAAKLQKELNAIGATTKVEYPDVAVARAEGELPDIKKMVEQNAATPPPEPPVTPPVAAPPVEPPVEPPKPSKKSLGEIIRKRLFSGAGIGGAAFGFLGATLAASTPIGAPLGGIISGMIGAQIGIEIEKLMTGGQLKRYVEKLFTKKITLPEPPTTPAIPVAPPTTEVEAETVAPQTTAPAKSPVSDVIGAHIAIGMDQLKRKAAQMETAAGGTITVEEAPGAEPVPGAMPGLTGEVINPTIFSAMSDAAGQLTTSMTVAAQRTAETTKVLGDNFSDLGGRIKDVAMTYEAPKLMSPLEAAQEKAVRYGKWVNNRLYDQPEAAQEAQAAQIEEFIQAQTNSIKDMTGVSAEQAGTIRDELATILGKAMRTGTYLKQVSSTMVSKGIETTTPEALIGGAQGVRERYEKSRPYLKTATGMEKPTGMQKLFGEDYKIKLAFRGTEELERLTEEFQTLPGFKDAVITTMQEASNLGEEAGQKYGHVVIQGHLKGKDLEKNREIISEKYQEYATQPEGALPERAQLEFMTKRQSLQQKLNAGALFANKLNWLLVRGQMALLGIAFSMMSVVKMLQSAWGTIAKSISNLETIFKDLGMAMAFGPAGAQKFMRNFLGMSGEVVTVWKRFTGYQATVNSLLAYFAFRLLQDTRIIKSIEDLIIFIIEKLSDQDFIDNIAGLIANVIEALPGMLMWVEQIVGALKGLTDLPFGKEFLSGMFGLALAAQLLMGPLAVIGGLVYLLAGALKVLSYALAIDLSKTIFAKGFLAGWLGTLSATITQGLGVLTGTIPMAIGTLVASITAGVLIGLVAVRLMIQSGLMDMIAGLGNWIQKSPIGKFVMDVLKIILMPFALLGTLIIDIVTLQFERIPTDLAHVVAMTIQSLLGLIKGALSAIPIIGPAMAEALGGIIEINNKIVTATTTSTQSTRGLARGGKVRSGEPIVVGEEGPEVFVPGSSGDIIPNHMIGYAEGTVDYASLAANLTPGWSGGLYTPEKEAEIANLWKDNVNQDTKNVEQSTENVKTEKDTTNKMATIPEKIDAVFKSTRVSLQNMFWDTSSGTYQEPGKTKPIVTEAPSTPTQTTIYGSDISELYRRRMTDLQRGADTWLTRLPESYFTSRGATLATGGEVKRTGIALLHKGEDVIPSDETERQSVQITNYVTATVNNKTDEKYLLDILGRKYYSGAY